MREYPLRYTGTDRNLKKKSHYYDSDVSRHNLNCSISCIFSILCAESKQCSIFWSNHGHKRIRRTYNKLTSKSITRCRLCWVEWETGLDDLWFSGCRSFLFSYVHGQMHNMKVSINGRPMWFYFNCPTQEGTQLYTHVFIFNWVFFKSHKDSALDNVHLYTCIHFQLSFFKSHKDSALDNVHLYTCISFTFIYNIWRKPDKSQ